MSGDHAGPPSTASAPASRVGTRGTATGTDCLIVRVPASPLPVTVRVWPAADVPGSRRPVLLCLHGWTESGAVFGPLAAALGGHWTVVAPDAPGHGGTAWPPGPVYPVPDHLAGAAAVHDALPEVNRRRAPVVVLGHGMGALTGARLAAARPGSVAHLVLEEPVRVRPRSVPAAAPVRERVLALQALDRDGRVAWLRERHPDWPPDEHGPWASAVGDVDPAVLVARIGWGPSLPVLLAEVACPVTIVHADPRTAGAGPGAPSALERCTQVCAAGGRLVALPAGRDPRRQARDRFVAELTAVLDRHGTA